MSKVLELFGCSTYLTDDVDWQEVQQTQHCPFLERKCLKTRKSQPQISIGTCTVEHGRKEPKPIVICPHRMIDQNQIFLDCFHLLTLHEPGNQLHIVPEISIPGGNVDYFLVSAKEEKVIDFVGIEIQTLDTTGTVWPERQRFLQEHGVAVNRRDVESTNSFGMNWKMTAKTILVQIHHKIQTFENINKRLVLVVQDHFMEYVRSNFRFDHLNSARLGDAMHIHQYNVEQAVSGEYRLNMNSRFSTDAEGIAISLGLQADANVELERIIETLEAKISDRTRLNL